MSDQTGPTNDDTRPEYRGDEATVPKGTVPRGAVPEGAVPEGAVPEGAVPEGAVPEGASAEHSSLGPTAPAQTAPLQATAPNEQAPNEQAPNQQAPNEQPAPTNDWSQAPKGQALPTNEQTVPAAQTQAGGSTIPGANRDRPLKPGPRTGPIVWGALVLAFCGYIAQRVFGSGAADTAWWIAATVVGLGAILLIVGIAVVIRGARSARR